MKIVIKFSFYKIIYKRSWFQPIFNKKQAFPVLISENKDKELIYGELTLYKERFLHSALTLRLAKKDSVQKYNLEIEKLYNFNDLIEQIQEENSKVQERTYFWKDSFISEMKISLSFIFSIKYFINIVWCNFFGNKIQSI